MLRCGARNEIPPARHGAWRSLVALATALIKPVFDEVEQWAPRLDFADARAAVLARNYERAFVPTTDFQDFSDYRVPFAPQKARFTSEIIPP